MPSLRLAPLAVLLALADRGDPPVSTSEPGVTTAGTSKSTGGAEGTGGSNGTAGARRPAIDDRIAASDSKIMQLIAAKTGG